MHRLAQRFTGVTMAFKFMARCLLMPCAVVVGICQVVLCSSALVWGLASSVDGLLQTLACHCRLSVVC